MNTQAVGIDLGTFHTVAVEVDRAYLKFPSRSVPSIAIVVGNTSIVGVDAVRQLDLPQPIMLAPKMKLRDPGIETELVGGVLRKLVDQALRDLAPRGKQNVVLTVPPGWGRAECEIIRSAVSLLDIGAAFLHEPVAVLAAVRTLALRDECNPVTAGQLSATKRVLICDWGAGTVDLALVEVAASKASLEFKCTTEMTRIGHGGSDIARDVIRSVNPAMSQTDVDKSAFRLQAAWQQGNLTSFTSPAYVSATTNRRGLAAKSIAEAVASLLHASEDFDRRELLVLLYGGPLESLELRRALILELAQGAGIDSARCLPIDNEFVSQFKSLPNLRRDCLVAFGAGIFGRSGVALPEFEYVVTLRDSFGRPASEVRLVRGRNLEGVQVVSPPFTGVDYFVDVTQITNSGGKRRSTNVAGELTLHVRKGAVVLYRIAEAGVGYAKIEAAEARDLPSPELFQDSRVESVLMPEKSTRFTLSI